MSKSSTKQAQVTPTVVVSDSISYEPVATVVHSSVELDKPVRVVNSEFNSLPEARGLSWEDDFFDDDDVVAVFDFDYEAMESFYSNVGWVYLGATILYPPVFWMAVFGGTPCFLRKNVSWSVNAQHVAITRDGIRFVRDKRRSCWGMPCTDSGKSSKTVPFDKITDCDIEEPAGNTCLCVENVLTTVNIDTASSGGGSGRHELQIVGLKNPHAFKKLVWGMKRARSGTTGLSSAAPAVLEMVDRGVGSSEEGVATLLREIRDELRQNNTLLQNMKQSTAMQADACMEESQEAPPPTNPEIV